MKALVFLEHHDGAIEPASLGVLSKAASLGADVGAVLVGQGPLADLAATAGSYGAATVHVAEGDGFDPPLPQPRIDVLAQVVADGGYDTVLLSTSVLACDVAGGLAGRLDAGINWDLIDLVVRGDDLVGHRLALQDAVLAEVGWRSSQRIALFRTGSFEATPSAAAGTVVPVDATPGEAKVRITSTTPRPSGGPSIADADVVVAGGIGLGAAEGFALAEELAKVLGGAVGATRAAVYKGWYPVAAQVGQTGKTVSPKLYIALGISGAVQHKVGMQSSKTIVSINSDPEAPIFEFSDLAVVGDVHQVVPALIELLRERKGS